MKQDGHMLRTLRDPDEEEDAFEQLDALEQEAKEHYDLFPHLGGLEELRDDNISSIPQLRYSQTHRLITDSPETEYLTQSPEYLKFEELKEIAPEPMDDEEVSKEPELIPEPEPQPFRGRPFRLIIGANSRRNNLIRSRAFSEESRQGQMSVQAAMNVSRTDLRPRSVSEALPLKSYNSLEHTTTKREPDKTLRILAGDVGTYTDIISNYANDSEVSEDAENEDVMA